MTTTPASALPALRAAARGAVLVAGDPAYEAHRAGWGAAAHHRPAAVVIAETEADVVVAARHAQDGGLRLVVRATGRGGRPDLGPDVLVVDVARLVGVDVRPSAGTAVVAAGTTWSPVVAAAAPAGLAPVAPAALGTGVVGSTLVGGVGWLARTHGLSRDAVRVARLVTPDGTVVRASPGEHPELLWALRGGGPSDLGVVVGLTLGLVPLEDVYAGELRYPAAMAPEVMARWAEWVAALPAPLTSTLVLDAGDGARRPWVGVRGCAVGPEADARALVDSWRRWAEPAEDAFGRRPFAAIGALDDGGGGAPPATTEWLRNVGDEVAAVLCSAVADAHPDLGVRVEVHYVAGAVRPGAGPDLGDVTDLLLRLVARPVAATAHARALAHLAEVRRRLAATGATTTGAYLGFLGEGDGAVRVAGAHTPASRARLRAVHAAHAADRGPIAPASTTPAHG